MSQTMADLTHLIPTAKQQNGDAYNALHAELAELRPQVKELAKQLLPLEAEFNKLDLRCKYLPQDRKLKKQRKLLGITLADIKNRYDAVIEITKQLQLRMENILVERRRLELDAESRDYDFLSPFTKDHDDPLVMTVLMSALCESLQYQYISGSRYYHWLIDQVAKANPDGGASLGSNDMNIPEIETQWLGKLDDMRKKREYLMVLRMATERAFRKALAELPENAPFTPKMLRRTDEELEAQLTDRGAQRWVARQQNQAKVASAEHGHARKEDKAYKPRL